MAFLLHFISKTIAFPGEKITLRLTVLAGREDGVFSLSVCVLRHDVSAGFQSLLAAEGATSVHTQIFIRTDPPCNT